MGLNFGTGGMFGHSNDFNQGMGQVRAGQGTVLVSKDGTGDVDTIQEALNLVGSNGVIYIKEGEYTEDLTISGDKVALIGSGIASIITGSMVIAGDNVYLDKLFIKGTSGSGTRLAISGDDFMIVDCKIGGAGEGLTSTGSRTLISNCNFLDCQGLLGGGFAIELTTGDKSVVNACIFSNSKIIECSQNYCIISNNTMSGGNEGIEVSGDSAIISNNSMATVKNFGVLSSGNYNNIEGNIITNVDGWTGGGSADAHGIKISGTNSICQGNIIYDVDNLAVNFGYGIWVTGDYNILNNNRIETTTDDGILVDATADRTLIDGNIILNWTNEAIDNNGTNTVTGDNILA